MNSKDPKSKDDFGLAVCGLGTAGAGLFLAAANYGVLDSLLEAGAVGFERQSPQSLDSELGFYGIVADSLSDPFLELLEEPAGDRVLRGLADTQAAELLRGYVGEYPPLQSVGQFLSLVSKRIAGLLDMSSKCELHAPGFVAAISIEEDAVIVHCENGVSRRAKAAVLAFGGDERRDLVSGIGTEIHRRGLARDVFTSSELFRDPTKLSGHKRITILGGAHSAWALAALALDANSSHEVVVVERRWPRVFYASSALADRDDYAHDRLLDVCPLTGRVHRLGGLRGPARALAIKAMRGEVPHLRVATIPFDWVPDLLLECGALPADALVTAFGYEPRIPQLLRHGVRLTPLFKDGALDVGSTGHVRTEDGHVIPGLFALGLGAGLRRIEELGGERSYEGRLDGIWLYHHTVGKAVLQSIGLL